MARDCDSAGRSGGGVPRTRHLRLRDQRPAAAGHPARRGGSRRSAPSSRRPPTCCRCCWSARRCATWARCTTAPWRSIAARLLGVVPKIHLPNYREFYEPRHFVSGDGTDGGSIAIGRPYASRSAPTCCSRPTTAGLIVHAEICEDVWVPIPPSGEAALAGATVLANLSASNITIGKAETRRLLCRSQSARCLAAYLYAAAGARENPPPTWPGTARPRSSRTAAPWPRPSAFRPATRRRSPTSTSTCCAQERLQMGSFDANRRRHARAVPPHRRSPSIRPPADIGLPPPGRALSVRARRPRPARAGLLRGLQHPGLRPGAAAARHRHRSGW